MIKKLSVFLFVILLSIQAHAGFFGPDKKSAGDWEMLGTTGGTNSYSTTLMRMAVPGGWLVQIHSAMNNNITLTFYPDPNHEWLKDNQ